MVSLRCKMVVKEELHRLNIPFQSVDLGEAEIRDELSTEKHEELKKALLLSGLELMDDKRAMLVEKIKNVITEMVHYSEDAPKINFSNYLSDKLNYDYTYLSNLFSEVKGITIEHYMIAHKIERVKELLIYDEHTLTEIAFKMHYSSVAHLSNQFKKVTGLTPSFFKKMKHKRLTNLEQL
jgi:AraC-like DNA-binding protein